MSATVARVNGRALPDLELEAAARGAIERLPNLRIWGHALQIAARDGVVDLFGHVRTRTSKETAARVVRQLAGVKGVTNNLYVDTELEIAVAQALAQDPRTVGGFPGILVGSAFGEVALKGNVPAPEMKKAAEQVAAKVPGVRAVNNQLVAPEPPKPAAAAKPAAAKPTPKPKPEEAAASEE